MKLIHCQLEITCVEQVIKSVNAVTSGMTIWEAREDNDKTNYHAFYRGHEYQVSPPRLILEIVTDESWVDDILRALATAYKSEPFGSENVRVFQVEASVHVRTGFMDG